MENHAGIKRLAMMLAVMVMAMAPAAQAGHMADGDYFNKADKNSDGSLTKEEMGAMRMQRLGAADTDKDGAISPAELTEHRAAMMRANQDRNFSRFTERFDADKDGKVTLAEVQSYDPPFFKTADANGDGKLTQEEMEAAKAKHHSGMMGAGHKSE